MMFALVKDGVVVAYPYTATDAKFDNPNISFPAFPDDESLALVGVMRVAGTPAPVVDRNTHKVVELTPVFDENEQCWTQVWQVAALTAQEMEARNANIRAELGQQIEIRLDQFAQTRNYDTIQTACTYASSSIAEFAIEGQYCVSARDATWSALLTLLNDVQAGARPMPSGYSEIEPELPVLVWPA